MLREVLKRVGEEYLFAKGSPFSANPLAHYVRTDAAKKIIRTLRLQDKTMLVKGSVGQSTWADVPWFSLLDPLVTQSTQNGYYIVILFSSDMKRVYLCLGQGVTSLKEEFPKRWEELLEQRAQVLRSKVPEFSKDFELSSRLNLQARTTLAKGYEISSIFHKEYDLSDLPTEEEIQRDFKAMLQLYKTAIYRGGVDLLEVEDTEEKSLNLALEEKKQFRMHKRVEGRINTDPVKRHRGYTCEACTFNFTSTYGELGKNFIEAHHLIPYSQLKVGETRKLDIDKDFAVLCANCHRMIHRFHSPHDLSAFKKHVAIT